MSWLLEAWRHTISWILEGETLKVNWISNEQFNLTFLLTLNFLSKYVFDTNLIAGDYAPKQG